MSRVPISAKAPGEIVYVQENNVDVPYVITQHEYQPNLTLLVRKENCMVEYGLTLETAGTDYEESRACDWCNNQFWYNLNEEFRNIVPKIQIKIRYDYATSRIITANIFLLSLDESRIFLKYIGGKDEEHGLTRDYGYGPEFNIHYVLAFDWFEYFLTNTPIDNKVYLRPSFCIPSNTDVNENNQFVFGVPPVISGSDIDVGVQSSPYSYTYTVSDEDAADQTGLQITEKLVIGSEIRTLRSFTANSGSTHTADTSVIWTERRYGSFSLVIGLMDNSNNLVTRTIQFSRVKAPVVISGADEDYGVCATPFTYDYTISDGETAHPNSYAVTEKVLVGDQSIILRSTTANGGSTLTANPGVIWEEGRYGSFRLVIEVSENNQVVATRTIQFSRLKAPVTISGEDQDYDVCPNPFLYDYTISDGEDAYPITYTIHEKLLFNDQTILLRTVTGSNGSSFTADFSDHWLELYGSITLMIEVADPYADTTVTRQLHFFRDASRIAASRSFETVRTVSQCLFLLEPRALTPGSTLTFEVCNNPFDPAPVWTDISDKVNQSIHTFSDTSAENPGLAYRFIITEGDGETYLSKVVVKYI